MNISRIPQESFLGKALRLPLKLIPRNMRVVIFQGALRGKKWIIGSSNHGCWLGSFEYNKRILFEKVITETSTVYDIGAHVGFYTLLSSILVGEKGKVFAFEPLPRNLYYLNKHLRLNGIKNVEVVEAAVSDNNGVAIFQEGKSSSMGRLYSSYEEEKSLIRPSEESNLIEVRTIALDKFISEQQMSTPDFIKIDVEGGEREVLLGAEKLLTNNHPAIFLATHGNELHDKCCEYLASLGYLLEPIGEDRLEEADEILATWKRA